jgi:HSP20 family molecular chaperone IbpA
MRERKVAELLEGQALTSRRSEETIMATSVAVQRTEEKPVTITPVENLRDRINKISQAIAQRAYEIFEGNGRNFGHDLDDWFKAEADLLHPVHVNLTDAGENLEVKAEILGFSEKEIEVSVEPDRLTITGKRETETRKEDKKGKTVYSESCSNQILRIVDLPAAVNPEKTTATLKNGVLNLTMAKTAKAKTIEIKPKAA